jgi:serine/threonine protein kinase
MAVAKNPGTVPETRDDKDPLIGKQFGDYRLTSVLATGGMSRIYKGMDYKLQRQAAVKVLSQTEIDADKTLTKRFQREARAVAALEHDNIITIYQYGEQDGVYFLAMKLVKGKDLAQELKRLKKAGKKMEVDRALRIMEQVASALDVAHAAGIVHRDIKPSNILMDGEKAILTDFGLVLSSVETTMGTAFGTPRYIAPEQAISSNKAVPQSDIYSFAVIMYEILTGETPFSGDSPMEIALSHISDPPPPPRSIEPSVPVPVEKEILKALEKEPEKRHRTAAEFIQAIKRGYEGQLAAPYASASAMSPSTVSDSSNPALLDSWDTPPVKNTTSAMDKSTVNVTANPTGKPRPKLPLILGAAAALVIVVVVALLASSIRPGDNPSVPPVGGSQTTNIQNDQGAPVDLVYTDTAFSITNTGGYTLDVNDLQFIRGEDGGRDDYNGYRISKKILPAGSCARIVLQSRPGETPKNCKSIQSQEFLVDQTMFFWRKEGSDGQAFPNFEVRYKGNVIATCNTVARGGDGQCSFTWPVPAPTPLPQ